MCHGSDPAGARRWRRRGRSVGIASPAQFRAAGLVDDSADVDVLCVGRVDVGRAGRGVASVRDRGRDRCCGTCGSTSSSALVLTGFCSLLVRVRSRRRTASGPTGGEWRRSSSWVPAGPVFSIGGCCMCHSRIVIAGIGVNTVGKFAAGSAYLGPADAQNRGTLIAERGDCRRRWPTVGATVLALPFAL